VHALRIASEQREQVARERGGGGAGARVARDLVGQIVVNIEEARVGCACSVVWRSAGASAT
jgi:hypothetical protein